MTEAIDVSDVDKLGEYYASIMAEISELTDYAARALARAAPPATSSSRRHVEAACLSIRRACEYIAVACVFAHHWDGHQGPNLMVWSPKDLLASVVTLSEHPTPAPLGAVTAEQPMQLIAQPIEVALLVKLYGQCSSLLHVGRPDRILRGELPPYDLGKLTRAVNEIKKIARSNVLLLPGIQRVVIWHGAEKRALVGEAPGDGVLQGDHLPTLELSLYD